MCFWHYIDFQWPIRKSFYSFPCKLLENHTALHIKSCWKEESGWVWTGGSTSSKDTCLEIRRDGKGEAVKDSAAVVSKTSSLVGDP